MNVGQLKKALAQLPDETPVFSTVFNGKSRDWYAIEAVVTTTDEAIRAKEGILLVAADTTDLSNMFQPCEEISSLFRKGIHGKTQSIAP